MIESNSWRKVYDFSTEDLSPDDTYWSDDDSIQNHLDELPLEDPDTDMKAPVVHKTRNRPATGTIEKLHQDAREDIRPPSQRGLRDLDPNDTSPSDDDSIHNHSNEVPLENVDTDLS
jgi:hypothetical protein